MAVEILSPAMYTPFVSKAGPVFGASIYIGDSGKNPKEFPQQTYAILGDGTSVMLPSSLQTPAIKTGSGGVPVYNGNPVSKLTTGTDYSILIEDKNGAQIYFVASNTGSNQGDGSTVIEDFEQMSQAALDQFNADAAQSLADFEADANNLIYSVGFEPVGVFQIGASVTSNQQTLTYNGEEYRTDGAGTVTQSTPDTDPLPWYNVTLEERKTVARSLNVKDNEVIYHDDTVTLLDDVYAIYDKSSNQKSWIKPPLIPNGATISSVVGDTLTYNPGAVQIKLIDPSPEDQVFDIMKFGVNQSETQENNFLAAQAAIDAANLVTPTGSIKIGRGEFRLSEKLISPKAIKIFGLGKEQSRLVWDENSISQGIEISYDSTEDYAHPDLRDLTLVRDNAYGGTAYKINGQTGGGHPESHRFVVDNVRIQRGQRFGSTGSWLEGIVTENVGGGDIRGYSYQGDVDNVDPSLHYGVAIRIKSDDAFTELSVHHNISDFVANRCSVGVQCSNSEGLYMNRYRIFNVDYGVIFDNTGSASPATVKPRVALAAPGHIQAQFVNVWLTKCQNPQIEGINSLELVGTSGHTHFLLDGSGKARIQGNQIHGTNAVSGGIKLTNSTFDCMISENMFYGVGGDCIAMDATSENNYVGKNFVRFGSWSAYLNNLANFNLVENGVASVRNTASQVMPGGASTELAFTTVDKAELGVNIKQGNALVAGQKGRYKARVMGNVTAGANDAQIRVGIYKNGANSIGTGDTYLNLIATKTGSFYTESLDLDLLLGDSITVRAVVSAGDSVTILGNCMFELEFIGTFTA